MKSKHVGDYNGNVTGFYTKYSVFVEFLMND
jgi:hypothetical protein